MSTNVAEKIDTAKAAEVALIGVRKNYGEVAVVHGVDLSIELGEFVVFVGPSGCGKSTLLRMIAGLEPITAGGLMINGQRMNTVPPASRGIAMVFQSYALYPHMSVYQNLAFALETARVPRAEIAARVTRAAEILQIVPLLQRKPKQLSGGQRQRVAIGRAIVREPNLFLFDEPLSNLDAELRVQMRVEIAKLHQRLGSTMIYVTHDQVEAMTMADKIVVLNAGRIEQFGPPLELYNFPVNRFVAGFIGSPKMNFLALSGSTPYRVGTQELAMPDRAGAVKEVGVRPEHIATVPDEKRVAFLSVTIELVESLGGQTLLYAVTSDGQSLTILVDGQSDVVAGDTLATYIDPAQCHAFAADGTTIR
ncbi:ABC transporter ATP-binding protein [uncultured Devosia sp.]|uniref:ABC transporter ATP-binding protein n=1 Tax=uncultured Devosia sp. TaxID=211434 RepID=UPI0035CA265A